MHYQNKKRKLLNFVIQFIPNKIFKNYCTNLRSIRTYMINYLKQITMSLDIPMKLLNK